MKTPYQIYMENKNQCENCKSRNGCTMPFKEAEKDTTLNALPRERLIAVAQEQQREQQLEDVSQCLSDIETAQQKRRMADVKAMRERLREAGRDNYP